MNEQHQFSDRASLDNALAEHIASLLRKDIDRRGVASLAVSGGSTPRGMFACLADQSLPWEHVYITLVDERWVDADSPDSNERLVRETLLKGGAACAHFIGMKSEHADAGAGLPTMAARLASMPLPFTCVVLGMGDDGHTASWFPGAVNLGQLLDADNSELLGVCDPITAPHQRMTLTLPAVLSAGEIILHITGDAKRAVLGQAAKEHYPVAAVTGQHDNPASIWWAP
jgi:6-phosphogluconolactonase